VDQMDGKRDRKMGLVCADPGAVARQLAEAPDRTHFKPIWAGFTGMVHVDPEEVNNVTIRTKKIGYTLT